MNKVVMAVGQWSRAGGLEIVVQDIARSFKELGWEVVVLASRGEKQATVTPEHIHVRCLEPKNRIAKSLWHRFFKYVVLPLHIRKELQNGGVLVLGHVHLSPLLRFLPRQNKVAWWAWTYGIDVWGKFGRQWAPYLAKLDRVVAISDYTRKHLLEAGVRSVDVVPCSVDVHRFVPTTTPEKIRRNEILICGRLASAERYKGHEVLFQSLPLVEKLLGKPVVLRIVGSGDDESRLKEVARNAGLMGGDISKSRVVFSGRVSDADLLEAYQHCAVFAMPSRAEYRPERDDWAGEGFGLVYVEASSCGRPVVCSTDGGAPETIVDGETGILADPRDPQKMAEALVKILRDPQWADELGRKGRAYAVQEFSFNRFKQRISDLLG